MKRIFILAVLIMPNIALAYEPSTECPTGFNIVNNYDTILVNTTCPAGYTEMYIAITSCLEDGYSDSCFMYAPANTPYTDNTGTYEFVEACPLE